MLLPKSRVLHIEPTDVCQAACPLCARETNSQFDKRSSHHLTVEQIKDLLPESWIAALDKMFMCGVYGDLAAGHHSLEIYDYFRQINPTITLGMNTNGGLRDAAWWQKLATILTRESDYVVFSIDGLADTNHLYRVNVSWERVMSNVETFIRAGGRAHWDMLVYKHNEHQVDACEQLARRLGFSWFRAKISKRPLAAGLEYPLQMARCGTQHWSCKLSGTERKQYLHRCQSQNHCLLLVGSTGTRYPDSRCESNLELETTPNLPAKLWHSRTQECVSAAMAQRNSTKIKACHNYELL